MTCLHAISGTQEAHMGHGMPMERRSLGRQLVSDSQYSRAWGRGLP